MGTKRKQGGVAAVELAIVIIPLVLLVFGITEFGRAIYQYNTLTKAARDGARHLSQHEAGDANQIAIARCLTVHGNRDCDGTPLAPGLTLSHVQVLDRSNAADTHQNQTTGTGVVNLVTVGITGYEFFSLMPFVAPDMIFGDISVTMRQVL